MRCLWYRKFIFKCSNPQKALPWVIPRFLSYSTWLNICQQVWLVGDSEKKRSICKKIEMLYFTTLPGSPRCTDFFYKSWDGGISPGRNHIFTISYQPVKRFWFCEGSNFAISHKKAWSPLTRCYTTVQSVINWRSVDTSMVNSLYVDK